MDEESDRNAIRAQISTMSFEELQKLKEEMGAKLYNERILNIKSKKPKTKIDFKRVNKNRPREDSSKRPQNIVPIKKIIPAKKIAARDPRFDPLCGTFEEKYFKKNYKFIDEIKQNERDALIKELEETEDDKRKKQIKYLIQRMDNQQREKEKRNKIIGEKINENEERKIAIKKGEKPIYQKKSEKHMMNILNRYEELKQNKKLNKHIEKKSKKILKKEKIKLRENKSVE